MTTILIFSFSAISALFSFLTFFKLVKTERNEKKAIKDSWDRFLKSTNEVVKSRDVLPDSFLKSNP